MVRGVPGREVVDGVEGRTAGVCSSSCFIGVPGPVDAAVGVLSEEKMFGRSIVKIRCLSANVPTECKPWMLRVVSDLGTLRKLTVGGSSSMGTIGTTAPFGRVR